MTAANTLTNPWTRLPASACFVLPEDKPAIRAYNERAPVSSRITLDTPPIPFLGHPEAPVVLLMSSPGAATIDPESDRFRAYHGLRECLSHASGTRFLPLLPENDGRSGSDWWRRRVFKHLLVKERVSPARLAERVFAVEFFPYWKRTYTGAPTVPSQAYGFQLVQNALARNALVITLVGKGRWPDAVPALVSSRNAVETNSINLSLSPNNLNAYDRLLRLVR